VFDADGVRIENETLYSTKNNELIGGVKNYQIHGNDVFAVISHADACGGSHGDVSGGISGGQQADLCGGAKKRGRKPKHVINLSSLSPEVASYFTF
jgi:hypothetical protein